MDHHDYCNSPGSIADHMEVLCACLNKGSDQVLRYTTKAKTWVRERCVIIIILLCDSP